MDGSEDERTVMRGREREVERRNVEDDGETSKIRRLSKDREEERGNVNDEGKTM